MTKKSKVSERKAIAEVSEIFAQHLFELPAKERADKLAAFKRALAGGRRDARATTSKRGRISGSRASARAEA